MLVNSIDSKWEYHLSRKSHCVQSYLCLNITEISEKVRYILQYCCVKSNTGTQAHEEICVVYGVETLSKNTKLRWFALFCSGNFKVKDISRSGRLIMDKVDEIDEIKSMTTSRQIVTLVLEPSKSYDLPENSSKSLEAEGIWERKKNFQEN